jgi:2-polyprenyl-3-methyl-5-hydroxy-6-metoxy-1,4-benzoquinol methylase
VKAGYRDLDLFLAEIKRKLEQPDIEQQLVGLSQVYFEMDPSTQNARDPFGQEYRDEVLDFYKRVSKNSHYDPMSMETTDAADTFRGSFCPIPYRFANSHMVGEFLSCYGWILGNLNVHAGADVLEYGAGEGQLCIHLARMGCNVHAIDIEQRFLDVIQKQCDALGVGVTTKLGRFGDGIDGKRFDRIIFFEAFHHCFDHFDALLRIRELLKPDGFVCFSGEPIIPADSVDRTILPYPWGLRLDGEAMRSISEFGWMELGYSEPYFLELLGRCGYAVERHLCPTYSRGNVYIGRKFGSRYPIELDTVISTYRGQSGWHSTEGTHRWTDGDAWFPLPITTTGYHQVSVAFSNWGPGPMHVKVSGPLSTELLTLPLRGDARVTLPLSFCGGNLRITSDTFRPESADWRTLGVAVKSIEFS